MDNTDTDKKLGTIKDARVLRVEREKRKMTYEDDDIRLNS